MPAPPPISSIPAAYTRAHDEYDALREGCGIDLMELRCLVEVVGAEQLTNLERVLHTRDAGGSCRIGVLAQGERVHGAAGLVWRDAQTLLLDGTNGKLRAFLTTNNVEFVSRNEELARMRLRGPDAERVTAAILGTGMPPQPGSVTLDTRTTSAQRVMACRTGADRFCVYCERPAAAQLHASFVAAGAVPVGSVALETVRIEDAEPCLERDHAEPVGFADAGMAEFAAAQASASRLVGVEHEGSVALERGSVRVGTTRVGVLRVGASSPRRGGRPIALCVVSGAIAPGDAVLIDASEASLRGRLTLPAAMPPGCASPNF